MTDGRAQAGTAGVRLTTRSPSVLTRLIAMLNCGPTRMMRSHRHPSQDTAQMIRRFGRLQPDSGARDRSVGPASAVQIGSRHSSSSAPRVQLSTVPGLPRSLSEALCLRLALLRNGWEGARRAPLFFNSKSLNTMERFPQIRIHLIPSRIRPFHAPSCWAGGARARPAVPRLRPVPNTSPHTKLKCFSFLGIVD